MGRPRPRTRSGSFAFPGGHVRPLSRPFPPFGPRALSAHLKASKAAGLLRPQYVETGQADWVLTLGQASA
jgi:hypothetical protein